MTLLHAHTESGGVVDFLGDVLLDGVIDTLWLLPFLFLTYLLMEFIEHRASDEAESFMRRAGNFGPLLGGTLGVVPQCGFSAAASNLYAGRVISIGTLVAVFLSTSDELLPLLISGKLSAGAIALILGYKAAVGILVGFCIDAILRITHRSREEINIDEICDNDNCHCERGIIYSAVHHTITISLFVLLVTILINTLIFFVGVDNLGAVMYDKPFISHVIASVFGLIPNCAASVVLSKLFTDGLITAGTMMSGLFSGAGVGVLVLFRVNRHWKENLTVLGVLVGVGILFGLLADIVIPTHLFS
jgi:hypothetical protein